LPHKKAYSSLAQGKLYRPILPVDMVSRPQLTEWLDARVKIPVTLVSAPAGYGKSTLISSWLDHCNYPHTWLTLDAGDNDLAGFLTYFLEAIRVIFPEAGKNTQALLTASSQTPIKELAISLVNDINQLDEFFILVLDDFEVIQEYRIHDFLHEFLLHPPRCFHLVLCTRVDPLLPILKLRAKSQLTEIRAQDLRFSLEESYSFLQKMLGEHINLATAKTMDEQSEGWVTGLRLGALALRHRVGKGSIEVSPTVNNKYVLDYLMSEILENQEQIFSEALLKTSILARFNTELCQAVCAGRSGLKGDIFLEWLLASNLFVISLDDQNHWVRYHNLFREFLEEELVHRYDQSEICTLHIQASAWFAGQGMIDEALHHALVGGDLSTAVQVVEQHAQKLLSEDKWPILEKWLAKLPDEIVQQRPALLIAKAWVLNFQGAFWALSQILQSIDTIFEEDPQDQSLAGEIDLFKAILLFWDTQIEPSLDLFRRALKRIPPQHLGARNSAEIHLALANQMTGQGKLVVREYQQMIFQETSEGTRKARLLGSLAFVHLLLGELNRADDVARQLVDMAGRTDNFYIAAWSSYLRGYVHYQWNDLEAASHHFSQALTNRFFLDQNSPIDCYAGLIFSYQAMGQFDQARETLHSLLEFAQNSNNPHFITLAHSVQARLLILQGDLELAIHWLKSADISTDTHPMAFWLEIPRITRCRVLIAEGSDESISAAIEGLREHLKLSQATHNTSQMIPILVLQALVYQKQSQTDKALAALALAITLAEPGGWIRPFVEPGTEMVQLLTKLVDRQGTTKYLSQLLAAFEPDQPVELPKPAAQPAPVWIESLTSREFETLELLEKRYTNKEIAAELHITVGTVQQHLNHIYAKLDVQGRRQAIAKAKALGLLPAHT
jgi:LuxR family maltose regulon positive regulatory protein